MKRLYTLAIPVFLFHAAGYAQSWEHLGTGSNALKANNDISALCYSPGNGMLYAGGQFTDSVSRSSGHRYVSVWNGIYWSRLGSDADTIEFTSNTSAICVDATQNVYVNGLYADGKFNIAKWDGVAWKQLGTGAAALNANHYIETICADNSGNIYAAGVFTNAAGKNYVARWDGVSWSELGTGVNALNANGRICSITTDNHGNVYAVGDFYNSLGWEYVAKWNGISWTTLGSAENPMNVEDTGPILSIYLDKDENLYAAGWFTNAAHYYYVAKWDGTSWSELGTGINALKTNWNIQTITGNKWGDIYAAGTKCEEGIGHCVARWNGVSWSQLGIGSGALGGNAPIWISCTDTSGNVYVGGGFTDGVTYDEGYRYVAKFNAPAAITPVSTRQRINAWPIPADEKLFIEVNTFGAYYYVYDMQGVLMDVMQNDKTGRGTNFIYVNNLPRGTYILKTDNAEACVFIKN